MAETLSAVFQRARGAPIEMNGRIILPIFQMKLPPGRRKFLVRRLKSSSASVTGLCIKVVKGEVEVNGGLYPEVTLWADTSPETVSLSVLSKSSCELKIWNVWRADDLVQAWVGDAGLVVSQTEKSIRLECSGGDEGVNFSALVVQIDQVE